MVILTAKTLGDKHRELNLKVIEALGNKTLYDDVNEDKESDIDKLFKIDLASKNKDLDYILGVLKSGSNLYVTRALKFPWIFNDNFSDIIHPTYLHYHIFPYMSERMKKKMLTTVSVHVRNEDRVICFYTYCINVNLRNLALKFLMYTPESFKMDLIKSDDYFYYFDDTKRLKYFIGNSIALAIAYIEMHNDEDRPNVIHELRFLYFVSKEEYLNILEKYDINDDIQPNSLSRLGIRITRDILKRHKSRVWKNPFYYINKLNKTMLAKYFVTDEIEKLAVLLFPKTSLQFWSMDYYHSYKFLLDLIPSTEIFQYLKQVFSSKYKDESFEMNIEFYNLNYFEMFTVEEKEAWALRHIAREEELFGSGNDYIWYKFVSFEKAFPKIKQYIYLTPDNDKRSSIVNILVDTIRCQEDLKKLINYYYDRHVNESEDHKMSFLDAVANKHDIYAFDTDCWTPLNSLFYSLEVISAHTSYWKLKAYKMRSVIYYILNNKEFTEDLNEYLDSIHGHFSIFKDIIEALSEERRNVVIKYWLNNYANKIQKILEDPTNMNCNDDIFHEIYSVWDFITYFRRDEKECPELVLNYMKSNLDTYDHHPALREKFVPMSEQDFVRLLKSDIQKAMESVSKIQCNAYRWPFKLTRFFRKVKVYFANDVAEEYLKYFLESFDRLKAERNMRAYRNLKMAVVGVFLLGDENLKITLLEKYVPKNEKNEYGFLYNFSLQIQKAICRLAYLSKPAVPLSNILKYITKDYVLFCLPTFNNYLVDLPMTEAFKFIYEIIDSPVSIQKHGLRLAFKSFSSHNLAEVILNVWKKTNNVSLRFVLYKTLFTRILNEDGYSQKELYEVLKVYTEDLNEHDHKDVFDLLVCDDMPENFRGDYIETAWKSVSKFSDKKTNLARKTSIIKHMKENIYSMNGEFVRERIIDEHVRTVLYENRLVIQYDTQEVGDLMKAKWDLVATYIVTTRRQNWKDPSLDLATDILKKCLHTWNNHDNGIYTTRQFCSNFLKTLHYETGAGIGPYTNAIRIYRRILAEFTNTLPQKEMYMLTWTLKMYIKSRRVIYLHHIAHNKCSEFPYPCLVEIADAFAKKIGKLVKQLVDRKQFDYAFYGEMASTLDYVCKAMALIMKVSLNGFKILVCGHLAQFKINEIYALAVKVMPKAPPVNWEKRHENVLKILKQYKSDEIQNHIAHKFVFAL